MPSFVKIFASILDSTVWLLPDQTRLVWITMLVASDPDGLLVASIPGLAKRAGVPLEACVSALETLGAPDPYSQTKSSEGRRIETIDGGWIVLNKRKYWDTPSNEVKRARDRDRQRRARQSTTSPRVAASRADVGQLESELERERELNPPMATPWVPPLGGHARGASGLAVGTSGPDQARADADCSRQDEPGQLFATETAEGSQEGPTARPGASSAEPVTKVRTRGTRLPEGWRPSDATVAWAREHGHDPLSALDTFADYWRAVPGARGVKLDWEATYRNWLRRDDSRRLAATSRGGPVQRGGVFDIPEGF